MTVHPESCGICRANRGDPPAPGGVIHQDNYWRIDHVIPPLPMAGWLLLKPLRHIESVADMNDEESAALGPLLRATAEALQSVTSAHKVYVAQFSEGADFAHIHFHLVPRPSNLVDEERGPLIFRRMVRAAAEGRDLAPSEGSVRVAQGVRAYLESHRP